MCGVRVTVTGGRLWSGELTLSPLGPAGPWAPWRERGEDRSADEPQPVWALL